MQQRVHAMFDLVQMQQAVSVRQLVRFGVTMGIALGGQIAVTILLGTISWIQQHILVMVLIELVWWPPFFFILYFSFTGVVKLVKMGFESYSVLQRQIEYLNQDYEGKSKLYELQLREKERRIQHLTQAARGKMSIARLEPWRQMNSQPGIGDTPLPQG